MAFTNKNTFMQIISAKPLIEQFKNKEFEDNQVGTYFLAYVILESVIFAFTYGEANAWNILTSIAALVITILGILHLKQCNNNSFGDGFFNRYFSLGWVTSVRMLILSIPAGVALFSVAMILGGARALAPAGALFTILYSAVFFWWLGNLIKESQTVVSETIDASDL